MNSESRDLSGEKRCTTIIRSGEALVTVTPMLRTSAGSRGCAIETRFCTCTCAMSRLVPRSKLTWMEKRPSAVEFDVHVEHVLDAVDLLLERRDHGRGDDLGAGAGILAGDVDDRRRDLGVLRDRQTRESDARRGSRR